MARDITIERPAPEDLSHHDPNSAHQLWSRWVFELRVTDKPAHDPAFQAYVKHNVLKFFRNGFGTSAQMRMTVYLEAGDMENGKPPDQLLMLPLLEVSTKLRGF